jgi:hypothetical protein
MHRTEFMGNSKLRKGGETTRKENNYKEIKDK